jgi:hypothetical protein
MLIRQIVQKEGGMDEMLFSTLKILRCIGIHSPIYVSHFMSIIHFCVLITVDCCTEIASFSLHCIASAMTSATAAATSSNRPTGSYVPRSIVDTFTFSDEIEQELARMDGDTDTDNGIGSNSAVTTSDVSSNYLSTALLSANAAATRAAVANPAAYAEAHFGSRANTVPAAPSNTDVTTRINVASTHSLNMDANGRHHSPKTNHSWRGAAGRPLSSGSSNSFAAAHAAASGIAFSAGPSAAPLSVEQHKEFYDEDAHYFNLGASSFPLLPHNSLYDDELLAAEQEAAARMGRARHGYGSTPIGPEQAFSPSGRVHAQHFTSILNQPASRLQQAAGPALVGASGFLPSLASIWTFTTGVQPPEAVARVSDDILSFAEDAGSSVDMAPFVLPPCPALDQTDEFVGQVAAYLKALQPHALQYRRNHPRPTFKQRATAIREKETEKLHAASLRTQVARERARVSALRQTNKQLRGITEYSDDSGDEKSSAATPSQSWSTTDSSISASSSIPVPGDDADHESARQLERDLKDCYSTVPSAYFASDFKLASLPFWQNENDLSFVVEKRMEHYGDGEQLHTSTQGETIQVNPYSSFNALSSYHSSHQFKLPSLAEQKAAQLRSYRASQERLKRMSELNEHHSQLQSELSTYLDQVEVTLLKQIAEKSWVFFQGLATVRDIQLQVEQALIRIAALRKEVAGLKSTLSGAGMAVLQQVRHMDNTRKLINKLELMVSVLKTSPTVQLLLAAGDFAAAMQLIQSTKSLLNTELNGLTCLKHVHIKLSEQTKLISQLMQMEFLGVAIRGGNFYLHDGSAVLKQKSHLCISTERTLSEEEQERLVPLVSHLIELNTLSAVFDAYKEELQNILKQKVMDLVADLLTKQTSTDAHSLATNDMDSTEKISELDQVAANSLLNDATAAPIIASATTLAVPAVPVDAKNTPDNSPSPQPIISPSPIAPAPSNRRAVVAMPVGHVATSNATASGTIPTETAPNTATSSVLTTSSASTSTRSPTPPMAAPSISTRLCSLSHSDFLSLLLPMFTSLMDVIQRASTVRHLALTVLVNSPVTNAQKESITRTLNDSIQSTLEFVHAKIGKILQSRSNVHAQLDLKQIRQFLDHILNFIQQGEKLAGKTLYGLRGTLLAQAKAFLQHFHQSNLSQLASALENEKWVRVDVPPEFQQLIDAHFTPVSISVTTGNTVKDADSSISDVSSNTSVLRKPTVPKWQSKSWNDADEHDKDMNEKESISSSPPSATPVSSPDPSVSSDVKRVLFVERPSMSGSGPVTFLRFPVVSSLLLLLKLIGQYVECASQLQAVGSDILSRLTELLQMFNSRSCQLVLGAGAMHLSGLKSVSSS